MEGGVQVLIGTMGIGGSIDAKQTKMLMKSLKKKNVPMFDTAIMYQGGKTEKVLGDALTEGTNKEFFKIHIKANPWFDAARGTTKSDPCAGLAPESIKQQVTKSLTNLKLEKADILYLHAPDHQTPLEDSLSAVNQLFLEGKFNEWGLSNYHVDLVW
eukprot:TRINITY_DN6381_c0_g1_i1.p1 TRINITY_DN6381_c0_g1~~TRINITY_DN6381_c0_g1_i1.p1  ORF type:complete len:157 (-),score=35.19 TRINITY_DN6381_c0_g1_i1:582-1052(-)